MHSLIDAVKNIILTALGVPTRVYRVSFTQGGPLFLANDFGEEAKTLLFGTTIEPGQNAQPTSVPKPMATDGLELSITRSDEAKETVAINCLVSSRLWTLRRFTLSATFGLPALQPAPQFGPPPRVYTWAATVIARDGDPSLIDTRDDTATTIVGATHQVRNDGDGVTVALATGGGSGNSPLTPIQEKTAEEAYQGPVRWFVLDTDIDCDSGRGWSRLRSSNTTWKERSWSHPFTTVPRPGGLPITAVGFGLAMPRGVGRPAVVVYDFSIYKWGSLSWLWHSVVTGLIRYR